MDGRGASLRLWLPPLAILLSLALTVSLLAPYQTLPLDAELATESTAGRLATWLARQSGNPPDELESPWARLAQAWAVNLGQDELQPAQALGLVASARAVYLAAVAVLLAAALAAALRIAISARIQPPPDSTGVLRGVVAGDPSGRPYQSPLRGSG